MNFWLVEFNKEDLCQLVKIGSKLELQIEHTQMKYSSVYTFIRIRSLKNVKKRMQTKIDGHLAVWG